MSSVPLITYPLIATSSAGLPVGPQSDTFTLSGQACPAMCELMSCDAPQEWDVRKGYGLSWATVVPSGEGLSKPVFEARIWEGQQQDPAWVAFCSQFLSRPAPASQGTTTPKSFGFFHPIASRPPHNVTSVVVLDCKYKGESEDGLLTWEISLLEWAQPRPAPPKPGQSTSAVGSGPPAAEDALGAEQNQASAELAGKREIYSSIPGGS
jgi:hypothetical protein